MRISDWSSDVCSSDLVAEDFLIRADHEEADQVRRVLLQWVQRQRRHQAFAIDVLVEPAAGVEIGRASCRERVGKYVEISVVAVAVKKKKERLTDKNSTRDNTRANIRNVNNVLI